MRYEIAIFFVYIHYNMTKATRYKLILILKFKKVSIPDDVPGSELGG